MNLYKFRPEMIKANLMYIDDFNNEYSFELDLLNKSNLNLYIDNLNGLRDKKYKVKLGIGGKLVDNEDDSISIDVFKTELYEINVFGKVDFDKLLNFGERFQLVFIDLIAEVKRSLDSNSDINSKYQFENIFRFKVSDRKSIDKILDLNFNDKLRDSLYGFDLIFVSETGYEFNYSIGLEFGFDINDLRRFIDKYVFYNDY